MYKKTCTDGCNHIQEKQSTRNIYLLMRNVEIEGKNTYYVLLKEHLISDGRIIDFHYLSFP